MRFLVIGSGLEATQALTLVLGLEGSDKVWHLPTGVPGPEVAPSRMIHPGDLRDLTSREIDRCLLRDRWGKSILFFKEPFQVLEFPAEYIKPCPQLETLDSSLKLVRVRPTDASEDGQPLLACHLSDGSELLCTGVFFADGPRSRAREMMELITAPKRDPRANACWRFIRRDLLDLKAWEFRTAPGKSVEQLPLPGGRVRVKLRFRAPVGSRQTPDELRVLFSEFGADMEALLEGVTADEIHNFTEENPARVVFTPMPGCVSLGQAALGTPILDTFGWSLRLARAQVERMAESLLFESWEPEAWEPAYRDALKPLLAAEGYMRSALHYDTPLLRPIRDTLMKLTPNGIKADRIRPHLAL